jgi:hypothetical protein
MRRRHVLWSGRIRDRAVHSWRNSGRVGSGKESTAPSQERTLPKRDKNQEDTKKRMKPARHCTFPYLLPGPVLARRMQARK